MTKFLANAMLIILSISNLFSQINLSTDFESPLNIPLFLSGNYGELRKGHFHAGIDIKTEGVTGKPVFSAYDGYVSRIKIRSGGYGNAIYIAHPNGYTSVFGHLDRFIPSIQEYVEKNQYEKQKFEIELFPGREQFKVQQGDVIAYSGNTGRSGGPHLHFEIRKSNGQVPLNGLRFNLPVADNIPPVFKTLYVYELSEKTIIGNNGDSRMHYEIRKINNNTYRVDDLIPFSGNFAALGVEVYDYLNGSPNRCGIYTLKFFLDDTFQYGFTVDGVSFANTRYINAHMDYELKAIEGRSVHRLHAVPNNRLRIYNNSPEKGFLRFADDSIHTLRIEAFDVYGNKSILNARIRKQGKDTHSVPVPDLERVHWFEGGIFQAGRYRINIPPSSLYNDIYFDLKCKCSNQLLRDTLIIHSTDEPLHKSITIRAILDSTALLMKDKLIFGRINEDNELESEGGECIDSKLIVSTRDFGKYIVIADTVKPEITPVNFVSGKKYTDGQRMQFRVLDKLAGIHDYNAFIDDQWILLKYDAKSDMMEYTLDKNRLITGKNHTLRIEVRDEVGNFTTFTGTFYY